MWLVPDIFAVIVLIMAVGACARKGFIESVLGFASVVVSVLGAASLSGPLARFVYDSVVRGVIVRAATNSLTEGMEAGLVSAANWLHALPGWVARLIPTGLALGGPDTSAEIVPVVEMLVDATIATPVVMVLRMIFMCILFSVFMFIARNVIFSLRILDSIPLIGPANTLLGGVLGAGWGAVTLYGAALAANFFIAVSGGGNALINSGTLARGYLFSFFFRLIA